MSLSENRVGMPVPQSISGIEVRIHRAPAEPRTSTSYVLGQLASADTKPWLCPVATLNGGYLVRGEEVERLLPSQGHLTNPPYIHEMYWLHPDVVEVRPIEKTSSQES